MSLRFQNLFIPYKRTIPNAGRRKTVAYHVIAFQVRRNHMDYKRWVMMSVGLYSNFRLYNIEVDKPVIPHMFLNPFGVCVWRKLYPEYLARKSSCKPDLQCDTHRKICWSNIFVTKNCWYQHINIKVNPKARKVYAHNKTLYYARINSSKTKVSAPRLSDLPQHMIRRNYWTVVFENTRGTPISHGVTAALYFYNTIKLYATNSCVWEEDYENHKYQSFQQPTTVYTWHIIIILTGDDLWDAPGRFTIM